MLLNEFCKILTIYLPWLKHHQAKEKKLHLPSSLIATSKGQK